MIYYIKDDMSIDFSSNMRAITVIILKAMTKTYTLLPWWIGGAIDEIHPTEATKGYKWRVLHDHL